MNVHSAPRGNAAPSGPQVFVGEKFLPLYQHFQHKAYYGGRGSGKSHAAAGALVIQSAQKTERIACARQFQNSVKDSVKTLIEDKIKAYGLSSQFLVYEREIVHKLTESRFIFIGLDRNINSVKSLEGTTKCWVEEAQTISQVSLEILMPTIRSPTAEMWWTWNPGDPDEPVDKMFRGGVAPPNSIVQYVGIEDNPYFYQTSMPNQMWHMERGNPARFKHIWLGDYDNSYDSKIFTNIRIGRCNIPEYCAPRYGIDFGFAQDPGVVLKAYVIEEQKQIYIARAVFGRVATRDIPVMIDGVVEDRSDLIRADSSRPEHIEELQAKGYNVVGAKKGPGSVKSGITFLQGYEIVIDPDLEEMREEARLYTWQVDRLTRKPLSVPVDAHNHGWDALRYAIEDVIRQGADADTNGGVFMIPGF